MPRPALETTKGQIPWYTRSSSVAPTSGVRVVENASYRNWTGTVTPQYYKKCDVPHGLPNNPHFVRITTRKEFPLRRINSVAGSTPLIWDERSDQFNLLVGVGYPDHSWDVEHSHQALARAYDKAMAKTKDMSINVAQAVAEAQKTMDLVGDTARSIAKAVVLARKGKIKQAMKSLGVSKNPRNITKSAPDNWLALQYGWLPLLSDVKGAAEQLAKRENPPMFKIRANATASDSALVYKENSNAGQILSYELDYKSDAEVMLMWCQDDYAARTLSQLGISDPALLVWELLPYSFVVDWFIPVGKYLSQLNYSDGLIFKGGYVVKFTQNAWIVSCAGKDSTSAGLRTQYFKGNLLITKNIFYQRYPIFSAPQPTIPRLRNPLNPTRMLSGLALLAKSFGR